MSKRSASERKSAKHRPAAPASKRVVAVREPRRATAPATSEREITVSASEFKAKCLELFTRLEQGKLRRVTVTRRGKPVANITKALGEASKLGDAFGFMRDKIRISPDYDPFERVVDEPSDPFFDKTPGRDAA